MRTLDLIAKKRDGGEHSDEEIKALVHGYTRGDIPDYQISAWLMAVVWRGLTGGKRSPSPARWPPPATRWT